MTNEASGSDLRYVDRALQMFGIERSYMELASNAERAQALLRAMAVRGTDLEACAGMLERTGTGTKMPRPDECSEMTQSGYKAMQMLQPPGFDTLGDLDLTEVTSVSSLYDAVVGRPLRQEGHFGLVTTGAMTLSGATSSSWNDKNQGVQFGKHEEVWQVRSAPKGRIGKKLLPGELRKVVVLTRSTKRTDTVGRVSVIQLALLPPEAQQERPDSHRAAQTCGAFGVPVQGIHLWEHFGRKMLADLDLPEGKDGFHAVFSGYSLLQKATQGTVLFGEMQPNFVATPVLAGRLAGFDVPDRPARKKEVERCDYHVWTMDTSNANIRFGMEIKGRLAEGDYGAKTTTRLTRAARDVSEQLSLVGWLDKLADPFFDHALPDDALRPNGLMLVMAVAVRVACDPERWGLSGKVPRTPDDLWATRAMRDLIESVQPSVELVAEEMVVTQCRTAVDLLLEDTILSLQRDLEMHERDGREPKDTIDAVRATTKTSLEFLHHAGVALAIDVCAPPPIDVDGTTGIYTENGCAKSRCDPVQEARYQAAYEHGMGRLASYWAPPTRGTTRGARQLTLMRVLGHVERWLCTGTFHGIHLPPRHPSAFVGGGADVEARTVLCVNHTYDDDGNRTSTVFQRDELPPELAAATATASVERAIAEGKCEPCVSGVAGALAGGNKKKKRAAAKREAKAVSSSGIAGRGAEKRPGYSECDQIAAETLRRTKGTKGIPLTEAEALDQLQETMNERGRTRARATRDRQRYQLLHYQSQMEAGDFVCELLQRGVVRGITDAFDLDSFLVGRGSSLKCAHCDRFVNVVQGIAFSGVMGRCNNPSCRRPRCLQCVDEAIDAVNHSDAEVVVEQDMFGCPFCHS